VNRGSHLVRFALRELTIGNASLLRRDAITRATLKYGREFKKTAAPYPIASGDEMHAAAGSASLLVIRFTGPNGGIAENATVDIDAPNGTSFLQLLVNDASITTHGVNVGILNGFVPGNLVLIMREQDTVRDNRSPARREAS
jgi:hypothetical protein